MVVNKTNLIFGHDDNGQDIIWTWDVEPIEKIYWKTWKPKVTNVKVLTDLTDPKEKNRIAKDIYEQIMTREHPPKNKLTGIYGVRK